MSDNTNDYSQIIYEINSDHKIVGHEPNPSFSKNIDYPTFTLGFQHFIHQTKLKMDIINQFEGKKKIYLVMSEFEIVIDEYNQNIQNESDKYFDTKIIDKTFYKLWELFFLFDIIDLKDNDFTTILLDNASNDLLRSVMLYRKQFGKTNKNNKYFNIVTNEDYVQSKPNKKSNNTEFPVNGSIGKNKANLIITNGFKTKNAIYSVTQEQNSYKLILNQILYALKNQNISGTFICKIYESFTNVMSKIISCLTCFYEKVYITKPLTSRNINSEKYIVCLNFKKASNIDKIESIVEELNKVHKNLVDIFPKYNIDTVFKNTMISLNTKISNKQFINNNEIITFINNQNYRGYEYDNKRQSQINATEYWTKQFLINKDDYTNTKKQFENQCKQIINNNNALVTNLTKELN